MRKTTYGILAFFLIGLLSYSCDELLGDLINFDGDYYVMDFTLEPTSTTGLQVFDSATFDSEIDTILSDHNLDREKLKSVTLKEAILNITSEEMNFNFVDYLEITTASPGLEAKK
jgi:hypothetical protein